MIPIVHIFKRSQFSIKYSIQYLPYFSLLQSWFDSVIHNFPRNGTIAQVLQWKSAHPLRATECRSWWILSQRIWDKQVHCLPTKGYISAVIWCQWQRSTPKSFLLTYKFSHPLNITTKPNVIWYPSIHRVERSKILWFYALSVPTDQ